MNREVVGGYLRSLLHPWLKTGASLDHCTFRLVVIKGYLTLYCIHTFELSRQRFNPAAANMIG